MRHFTFSFGFLLLLLGYSDVAAQDLIVTIQKDSLNVKIEKENERFIYYAIPDKGSQSLVISKKQIADVVYGFYRTNNTSEDNFVYEPIQTTADQATTISSSNSFERFQVSASIGYNRYLVLIGDESQGIKDYYQQLHNGYNYSLQINYLFKKRLGVGLIFEQAHFENSVDGVTFTSNGGSTSFGTLSDDITLTHIGPNFIFRLPFKRSTSAIQFEAGFGFSSYVNKGEKSYGFEMVGYTLGLSVGASYQLSLGGGLYVPMKIGIKSAFFASVDFDADTDMPEEFRYEIESGLEEVGISGDRIELSIGLLYSF